MTASSHKVLERLARGHSVLVDGDVAAELQRQGYRPSGPLHDAAAAREAPEVLASVHRAFIEAGADVITAFTARTTVRALSRGGLGMRAAALTHRAVDIAIEAAQRAGRPVAVAGALGPLENSAAATPSPRLLAEEHAEQALRLATAGCDLVLVDAMPTLRETVAAVSAARRVMNVAWAVLTLGALGRTAEGATLAEAAAMVISAGANALLVQVRTIDELRTVTDLFTRETLGVPFGARAATPELGADDLVLGAQHGACIVSAATPDLLHALASRVRARVAA